MKTIKGYKFIKENRKSLNGDHTWEVGKWYKEKDIELCNKGFHACKEPREAFDYIYGEKFFIVEARGKIKNSKGDKFVAQEMRLVQEIPLEYVAKRFAIWCAKQCLNNFEKEYPEDKRPFLAIKASEDYLDGKINLQELESARSSAWSAAWSSAESAAWSAAESAAWSAARSSAWSAAWSSAESAAWSAESAARSAARSARSARSAESAAWSAQNRQLKKLIKEALCNSNMNISKKKKI